MLTLGPKPTPNLPTATLRWIAAAADDPGRRLPGHLLEQLDFREWASVLRSMQASALPESQLGASLLLGVEGLEIGNEMAWRSRYPAVVDGKRFIGTVHVHPGGGPGDFDAADLAGFLRSDYPGFVDLLVTAEGAGAVVRTRRFLYISAERVDRNPFLLTEIHPGFRVPANVSRAPTPDAVTEVHAAVRTVCHRYELALYRGAIDAPLRLEYRPR